MDRVRDLLFVLPDRAKVAWRRVQRRFEGMVLGMIDRYLAGRGEERVVRLLDFEEIPVLFDEADFDLLLTEGM